MSALYLSDWNPSVIVATNAAILAKIDAGAAAGQVKFYTSSDTLLGTVTLTEPAGSVNATTGVLTLTQAANGTAVASGDAAYCTLFGGDGAALRSYPCSSGSSPVAGTCVLNSTLFVSGAAIAISSFTLT